MAAGLLIGLGKPGKPGKSDMPGEKSAATDPETMAAEDLIDAVKGGDASAVASAFRTMYDACAAKKSASPYPEEEETELE